MAKRYVQANSVVLGMPRQTRPAALDGGRYGFYAVLDHIPIDHWTVGANLVGYICRAYREDNAKYDPEKHAHSSPFLPRAVPQDSEWFLQDSTGTLAIVFVSGQARRVISVRERNVKNTLRATGESKGVGRQGRERWGICRVHSTADSNVGGKVPSRASGNKPAKPTSKFKI